MLTIVHNPLFSPATFTRAAFDHWLAAMDDTLAAFLGQLPTSLVPSLDYSPDSLAALEAWLLRSFAATPPDSPVLDGAARYVGEVFRRALGGRWDIQLDDNRRAYAGLPILVGFDNKLGPVCPRALVLSALDTHTGDHIPALFRFRLRYGTPRAVHAVEPRRICRVCHG